MTSREEYKLAVSNLRLVLESMRCNYNKSTAQFVWKPDHNSTYYLYNLKSHLILASVSYSGMQVLIRYRTKGRYGGIIQRWAQSFISGDREWKTGYRVVAAVPSKHLNDHARNMRFINHNSYSRKDLMAYHYPKAVNKDRFAGKEKDTMRGQITDMPSIYRDNSQQWVINNSQNLQRPQ